MTTKNRPKRGALVNLQSINFVNMIRQMDHFHSISFIHNFEQFQDLKNKGKFKSTFSFQINKKKFIFFRTNFSLFKDLATLKRSPNAGPILITHLYN